MPRLARTIGGYFERMQDAQLGSVELAIERAKTAVLFRRPTKTFRDTVAGGGEGLRVLRLTGAIPVEGGCGDQDSRTAQSGSAAMK